MKGNSVHQTEDSCAFLRNGQGFFGKVDSRNECAVPCKIYRVCAYSAADLQNPFPAPAWKFRKYWNMRLDQVLSRFDFIEVFAATNFFGRVTQIAGTRIP